MVASSAHYRVSVKSEKTGNQRSRLETREELNKRIGQASRYGPLERLALSPQCGFATSIIGNRISAQDQQRKLQLAVETARSTWGESAFINAASQKARGVACVDLLAGGG